MKKNSSFTIGVYQLGYRWIDLIAEPDRCNGADFHVLPSGKERSQIYVGMNYSCIDKPWGFLIHEAMEFCISDVRGSFRQGDGFDQESSDGYVFHFDHNQLNEVAARLGWFTQNCFRDFEKAWKRCHRKRR